MNTIDANELREFLTGKSSGPVINVLDHDQYESKHIPGSINIPLEAADFVSRVGSAVANKDKPVVVYCASSDCHASEEAAAQLEEAGFTDVRDYRPGVEGWEQQGFELEGSDA